MVNNYTKEKYYIAVLIGLVILLFISFFSCILMRIMNVSYAGIHAKDGVIDLTDWDTVGMFFVFFDFFVQFSGLVLFALLVSTLFENVNLKKRKTAYEYKINEETRQHYTEKLNSTEPLNAITQKGDQILIVDADYADCKSLVHILRLEGYSITAAYNGKQALEIIHTNPNICLVISDFILPDMSSFDVCSVIRRTKDYYVLPVLVITAKKHYQRALMGFDAGVNDIICKPFDPRELKARVRTLVELKKSVDLAIRTEIKFLQLQIKPHFIHNALNTIISISRRDSERARGLLVDFSNYLRGCFDFKNSEDLVPVEKAVKLVQSYIAIEQARFGERLHVQYDIDNISMNIPTLIIQPIVENSVIHGLRPKPEGGKIIISVKEKEDSIIIHIEDDGVGMSEEKIRSLLKPDMSKNRVGLYNIDQRLRKMYGKKLHIESAVGKGTVIQIEIPNNGGIK